MDFLAFLPFLMFVIVVAAGVFAIAAWRREDDSSGLDLGIGTTRRLYLYGVSLASVMTTAVGVTFVLRFVLDEILLQDRVLSSLTSQFAAGVAMIIVGLPIWALHWRVVQRQVAELHVERQSLLRKFYIYVVLGVAAALAIFSANDLLRGVLGAAETSSYHIGAVIVWGAVWAFHWRTEAGEGQPTADSQTIRRLYLYAVTLITFVMLALGIGRAALVVLRSGYDVVASIPVLVPTEAGLWRPELQTALAAVLAGGAAWAFHWYYGARNDLRSLVRQVYLYVFAILGGVITVLTASGTVVNGTLVWLLGAPGIDSASSHFRFLPAAVAALGVGGTVWAYHWMVMKREAEASEQESRAAWRTYSYIMSAVGLVTLAIGVGVLTSTSIGLILGALRDVIAGGDVWRRPIALSVTLAILGAPLWGYYWRSIQRQSGLQAAVDRSSTTRRVFTFAVLGAGMLALLGGAITLLFLLLRDVLESGISLSTVEDARIAIATVVAVTVFLPYYWMIYRHDRGIAHTAAEAAPVVRKNVTVLVDLSADIFVRTLETELGYRVSTIQWVDPEARFPALSRAECRDIAQQISQAAGPRVMLVPDGATVRVISYR